MYQYGLNSEPHGETAIKKTTQINYSPVEGSQKINSPTQTISELPLERQHNRRIRRTLVVRTNTTVLFSTENCYLVAIPRSGGFPVKVVARAAKGFPR